MIKSNKSPSVAELNAAYDRRVPATTPLSQEEIHNAVKKAQITCKGDPLTYYGVYGVKTHPQTAAIIDSMKGVHFLEYENDDMLLGDNDELI